MVETRNRAAGEAAGQSDREDARSNALCGAVEATFVGDRSVLGASPSLDAGERGYTREYARRRVVQKTEPECAICANAPTGQNESTVHPYSEALDPRAIAYARRFGGCGRGARYGSFPAPWA